MLTYLRSRLRPQLTPRATRRLLWIGALLLISLAVWRAVRWYSNWVPYGPQQTVQTSNPKMGVHTRLTDEVEPWKIKRTAEMVREMGAPWVVEYFPWAYVEGQPGEYNWVHADQVVNYAAYQGLSVVARLGFVPAWARPKNTTPLYLDEKHFADFGHFAANFAARYADQVKYIIIGNEPNLSMEWGYQPVDPQQYVALLRTVYPLVKAANPNVQLLAGALAPTLAPPGNPEAMNDLVFLQRMYDLGAAPYFDLLAIHAYGWHSEPDEAAAVDAVNFRRAELLRAIMVRNGDAAKAAMITEGGWNDHPRWTRAVRPAQRIAYTLRAYEIARSEWPWMQAVCLWAFRYPWDAKSYQDYFAFVRSDFEPKPIYTAVQAYAQRETK